MKLLLYILLLLFATVNLVSSFTSSANEDSLFNAIALMKEDTNKIKSLNTLAFKMSAINPFEGILLAEKSIELSNKLNYKNGLADAYSALGVCYWIKSDFPKALERFYTAIKIFEQIDDKQGIAIVENNIGLVYTRRNQNEKAIEYYKKALAKNSLIGNNKSIIVNLNNIADAYSSDRNYSKALEYLFQACKLSDEIRDSSNISASLINIGSVYIDLNEFDKALDYLNKSLKYRPIGSDLRDGYAYLEIGRAHYLIAINKYSGKDEKNEILKSIEFYNMAIDKFIKTSSKYELQKAYLELSKALKFNKDYLHSLEIYQKYSELKDSLFSQDNSRKIATLESQREIDLIEKQRLQNERLLYILVPITISIAIISGVFIFLYISKRKTNRELEEKNILISEINSTKDKFFSIIAHDLKGPLGSFKNVTTTLNNSHKYYSQDELTDTLELIKKSADSVFSLLENLLDWARTQKGRIEFNPVEIDFYDIVNETINLSKLTADAKDVIIVNTVAPGFKLQADSYMLTTVVRNLISNAIKYSYQSGFISIKLESKQDCFEISVTDSGIGIRKEIVEKLFRIDSHIITLGANGEKGTGLGLILCKEFVEKHGGRIWVESEEGKGSTFYFTLPYSQ